MTGAAPVDVEALGAALADAEVKAAAAEARAAEVEAKACNAEAKVSDAEAQIAALKLMIEKLRRELYGRRSERKARLLDQLEMQLDELTATATEDELAAEQAAAGCASVKGFVRRRPARKPFPPDLPRERMVVPAPACCASCGSDRLSKIGEDVTETLEVICAASPASCRPMLSPDIIGCMSQADPRRRSLRRSASRMPGASSSSLPTSRPARGVASTHRRSRRWRWRP